MDVEATRRLESEMDIAADSNNNSNVGKGMSPPSPPSVNGQQQHRENQRGEGEAPAAGAGGDAGGGGGGKGDEEDSRTVYRWHVDSLVGGGGPPGMEVVPLMEEGVGEEIGPLFLTRETFCLFGIEVLWV